ncbi:6-phosphogluconolactonase [Pseudoroseicyclus tamaricis]|uniref:6-phosphogluconolactonase n=1 Tax=Pseudoroseicyclus tamaricis TaxID=2705421 RepID=A0A6B2JS41_9RHOB|nr:6-phosphogluconolactonase [Pseudoroseicyclus tamaricis]NDV00810.1 6-phosphogluconolactonase [Pseudoroseicyclus tamaricis]
MELVTYPDVEIMMISLADRLASELRRGLEQNDRVSVAVPGGTTPGPAFDALSDTQLDWGRVDVMLTDERWVGEDSPRSNTRLLRKRLLTGRAAAANLVQLRADTETPEEGLPALIEAVEAALPLTSVVLGMGEDMHTASIFPGADRLEEALHGKATLLPMRAPGAPEPRITLTARVLNDAMNRHILIRGAAKREALEKARHMSADEAPVAAILRGTVVHWAED